MKGAKVSKTYDAYKSDFKEKRATKHGLMPYFSIPQEIFENQNELLKWARKSIEIGKQLLGIEQKNLKF